jgi:formylglycine-generating enzyme required for sulfatase activity
VGSFPPNNFELFDMHGNVGEWTQDCYEPSLLQLPNDGAAYESGACDKRVIRNPGGSFGGRPAWLRSANRSGDPASAWSNINVGFRVAKSL